MTPPLPDITGFVLAAGEGRRLRPVTLHRPKALVPFCGVPLLELALGRLAATPVRRILVNAWHLADQIEAFCAKAAPSLPMPLLVSREPYLLDTGGGIRNGMALAPETELVLVHNSDVVLDFDLIELINEHLRHGSVATVLLVPDRGPRTVVMDDTGRIRAFRRPAAPGQFTFSGVYLLNRALLRFLPESGACSIVPALENAIAEGLPVHGLSTGSAFWSDLGRPADYIRAHGEIADRGLRFSPRLSAASAEQARRRADLERRGVRCTGALGIGANVHAPAGAQLHNAVFWDDTVLPKPVLYADSVFTGGRVPPPPAVDDSRKPDPRIAACLDLPPADLTFEPLRKQGSGRRYARLHAPGGRTWVWCAYNHDRRENAAFAALADFLARVGVNIPAVLIHLGDTGDLVSLDLGSQDLQGVETPWMLESYLRDVLRQVARLHILGDRAARLEELPLQTGFTKGLYDWERDYFREHILGRLVGEPELWTPAVAESWCQLRTLLLEQPQVPIHRDLQSANVMICSGKPYLIDFQGMRPGCAAYDVASLLFDPYKEHPAARRKNLWNFYQQQVAELNGPATSMEVFHAAAVQRLLQALGAYGKLWQTDGLDWYRPYIRPALGLLEEAAAAAGRPEIARLAVAVRDRVHNRL